MIHPSDPKAGYLTHRDEIDAAIRRTLESGWYILGQQVKTFESQFAAYVGVEHAIGVASGTDAIELALRTCGVGHGDVVLSVSHTAVATIAAIERCGAVPGLVDVDLDTFTIDPGLLERAIARTGGAAKVLLPVHLYGHPADMPAIMEIAHRHGLYVIEDCAQAHGAQISATRVGAWGHLGAFSFYPTKNLGALGDGGAIVTNDKPLADRARSLREYGWQQRYISAEPGINSRLDELQAAVLCVKLGHLDRENDRRRAIADQYRAQLHATDLVLPVTTESCTHVYHQFVVRSADRDGLRQYLHDHEIGTLIHYPVPVHQQPAYAGRLPKVSDLSRTEQTARQILSLPMYPELTDNEVATIVRQLTEWHKERK